MEEAFLIFNAGSSSVKFSLLDAATCALRYHGAFEDILCSPVFWLKTAAGQELTRQEGFEPEYSCLMAILFEQIEISLDKMSIVAIGHRVVHGGRQFQDPLLITPDNLKILKTFIPLAPLHQPHNLAAVETSTILYPCIPQVACFDTAFHRTQPLLSELFALPLEYWEAGVLRYGFHGLSYEYIVSILPHYAGQKAGQRVIIAHLGNGASLCALKNRQSIATTMGFTALDGLMMGTRCGNIDPGLILYLMEEKGMSPQEITHFLYNETGLKGVSGLSHHMHVLLESSEPRAKIAVDLFCFQAARQLGSLLSSLGGLDVLVFTAGIGQNAPQIRQKICEAFSWLGLRLNQERNQMNQAKISHEKSTIDVYVIPTNEELMIAQQTKAIITKTIRR